MQENKNKLKTEWSIKKINKVFGIIVFVLVFLFTFFFGGLKNQWKIILLIFGPLVLFACLAWVITAVVFYYKKKKSDPNQGKISQALEELQKDAIEQSTRKIEDESDN